jgi:uncharacterized protein (UPF0147 family)
MSIAVLATSAIAPPAIAAAQAPSPAEYQTRGLLDDLLGNVGDLLGGLLGSSQQNQLTALIQQLTGLGGTNPSADLLRPLTDLLNQLGGAQGLPLDTRALIDQVTSLLEGGGRTPLDDGLLAPVANLLRQLAATRGLPEVAANLLNQLADLLSSRGAGLPLDNLDLLPAVIDGLNRALSDLTRAGGTPTADLLQPLIPLLDQVARTAGLPQPLRDLINQVIDLLRSTTGAIDPLLSTQISTILGLIGNTPGVSRETRTVIERTVQILNTTTPGAGGQGGAGGSGGQGGSANGGGGGGTGGTGLSIRRAATARDKAVIKRVAVNRQRTVASVRIACPSGAPAVCSTSLRAAVSGRSSKTVATRIGQGTSKLVKLKLTKAATRQLKRRGGKVTVVATTRFGSSSFSAKATVSVKRAKATARR